MKKNFAVIYRLAFVLFSIWAIFESVAFQIQSLPVKLLNFMVFSDTICLICILIVFIVSLKRSPGQGLRLFKTACTFLALIALSANLQLFFAFENHDWILKVLLPLMMLFDYLFFDNHGKMKFWHLILWLLLSAFVGWLLFVLSEQLFKLPGSLDLLGLFTDKQSLSDLLLNSLLLTGAVFVLDKLFSGELFKDLKSVFVLVFRIIFILLESWAFIKLSGANLYDFLLCLRYYENLVNFLCFLCMIVVLIYNLLHFKPNAKGSYVFSRVKTFFTIAVIFGCIVYHFYVKGNYVPNVVGIVLYYIAPLMMLTDWLFFDTSSHIRAYDPLIWMAFPVVYFSLIILLGYIDYAVLYPMLQQENGFVQIGIFAVVLLFGGYIFYLIDRFIKGR